MEITKDLTVENGQGLELFRPKTHEIHKSQSDFLKNTLDFALKDGLDFGIRVILPDVIEDQVIEIKDAVLKDGIKGGIDTIKDKIFSVGEAINGLFNGNFSSMDMLQRAAKDQKVLSTTSRVLTQGINAAVKNKVIDKELGKALKSSKAAILDQFSKDLDDKITKQYKQLQKLEKLNDKWEKAVHEKNQEKMFDTMDKINNIYKDVVEFDKIISRTKRNMELQEYIEKTGDFDLIKDVEKLLFKI